MSYEKIIENNCRHNSNINWWPKFAFHYTDVMNAIGILREGYLYSRYDASQKHLMSNDNASRQVIDMTYSGATSNVRFYFRPLTPTQYHNEGFKHPALRYCHDINANVPVPIFFLFDLNTLLQLPGTRFSEQSLAGGGEVLLSGEDNFAHLNFEQIYKNGYMENPELEKKYRHAEIIYPDAFEIKNSLRYIVCRNDIERATLLNLLRKEDIKKFSKYKDIVVVNNDCFENNGLYVNECRYYVDKVVIVYSKTANKNRYTNQYKENSDEKLELDAYAEFDWVHSSTLVERKSCSFSVDYENSESITFTNLVKPEGATALYMKVFFEKINCDF
ncbi:MAG: DarT ssDNA thymidine ADP-ribosyltransferase family protein [Lachnospiraceae bacterium]